MSVALIALAWTAASFLVGVCVGKAIRVCGDGPPPIDKARADYLAACIRGDTRKQKATLEAFLSAKHSQLAREIGYRQAGR